MTTLNKQFSFPGQTNFYQGKVRDVYTIDEDILVMVTSDRISAFDVILPQSIPYKGQVLNGISLAFLEKAKKAGIPNWVLNSPHPNIIVGRKLEPFKVEMIMRAYLTGSSWRAYKAGAKSICGLKLPDNMKEHKAFRKPLLTPTTKAEQGDHDENISRKEILDQGLVSKKDYKVLEEYTKTLFALGQQWADERGLILVDTKYEFGKDPKTGKIYVIDEIHTPDSSRYFLKESYQRYVASGYNPENKPTQLSKEFVREWLMANGFQGKEGQTVPEMDNHFINVVSIQYQNLYEKILGEGFKVSLENVDIEEKALEGIEKARRILDKEQERRRYDEKMVVFQKALADVNKDKLLVHDHDLSGLNTVHQRYWTAILFKLQPSGVNEKDGYAYSNRTPYDHGCVVVVDTDTGTHITIIVHDKYGKHLASPWFAMFFQEHHLLLTQFDGQIFLHRLSEDLREIKKTFMVTDKASGTVNFATISDDGCFIAFNYKKRSKPFAIQVTETSAELIPLPGWTTIKRVYGIFTYTQNDALQVIVLQTIQDDDLTKGGDLSYALDIYIHHHNDEEKFWHYQTLVFDTHHPERLSFHEDPYFPAGFVRLDLWHWHDNPMGNMLIPTSHKIFKD